MPLRHVVMFPAKTDPVLFIVAATFAFEDDMVGIQSGRTTCLVEETVDTDAVSAVDVVAEIVVFYSAIFWVTSLANIKSTIR